MSLPRYAARRDSNEDALVSLAEQIGALWIQAGPFDGWLWWRGQWRLIEIKRPDKQGHKDEYTPAQIKLLAALKERGIPVHTLRTEHDVYALLGARRSA